MHSSEKAVIENFASTDDLISRYQETFSKLRDGYTGRILTYTALVTSGIAATVKAIRFDQLMQKLRPVNLDQGKRDVCLPNTRLGTIKSILDWYSDDSASHEGVLWIYGLAGTGKSTLSTTIARMVDEIGLLGAFFFFDRQIHERDTSTLIRTVAYQLARFDARIGTKIEQILVDNPNVTNLPPAMQFLKLLSTTALGDIQWTRGPVLVIIDALDESGAAADRKDLLKALAEGFSHLPSFLRLLIVSRPERDIFDRFKYCSLRREELGVDSKTSHADIAEFIRARLQEIRDENIDYLAEVLHHWPTEDEIQALAMLAAGLFIWAATACRMIDVSQDPKRKTGELLKHHSSDIYVSIFTSLHQLYKTALQSAGNWDDELFRSDFQAILGTIICAQMPISCLVVDSLLKLPRPSLQTVSRLGSVLRGNMEEPIRILHSSFHDYLTLRDRNEPWAINDEQYNMQVADRCISHLEQMLHENMCNLTLPHPVQDESLPDSVSYASKYWIEHVYSIVDVSDALCDQIYFFLHKHLLHWLEALVILNAYDVALRSLPRLIKWIQRYFPESQLLHFVRDARRFAQSFSETIQEHPLLVYLSALPFTPPNTLVYQSFHRDKLPQVICGVEPGWSPPLRTLHGHSADVNTVAFSPDGSKIASGSTDSTVRLWNVASGQENLPPFQGHESRLQSVSFSPDGDKIVSGSSDGTVRVWNILGGQEVLPPLRGHTSTVMSVAFSPDASKIVSGSLDHTVRVWDALGGQEALPPLRGHTDAVRSVAFSPDGSQIISCSYDGTIRLWSVLTGQEALLPIQDPGRRVNCVAFSPDGAKIVSASSSNVRLWDMISGKEVLPPFGGHKRMVSSVFFSPDGSTIISASPGMICMVDALTGNEVRPPILSSSGKSIAMSPDGTKLVSSSASEIQIWDEIWDAVVETEAPSPPQGHDGWVEAVSFSPDGSKIVSGSSDNTIRIWETLAGKEALPPLRGHREAVTAVAFSGDGSKVISGSRDNTVRVWNIFTGQEILPPLQGHEKWVTSVVSSPDGSKIASGSADRTIRMWDILTGEETLPPLSGHEDIVSAIAFSLDGTRIVSGSHDNTTRIWDALAGQALAILRGHEQPVISVTFSPDGFQIASGSKPRVGDLQPATVRVWNVLSGKEAFTPLQAHKESVDFVAFSPDGTRILTKSNFMTNNTELGTARLWDAFTGQEILQPLSRPEADPGTHTGTVLKAADENSKQMVYLGKDRYFIEATTGRYLSKIPAGFSVNAEHHLGCGSCWIGWKKDYVPVIIQF
ncbi:hypothetical protein HWV62_15237 [Athelia sp. TMB]|nr:hypothetical protein HWV62_15237 [Athelia sp. TMB]